MKTLLLCLLAVFSVASGVPPALAVGPPTPALTQPAISSDGSRIAFAANGAIWMAPSAGGTAHILVSDSAADSRPLFSPDGEHLVFVSDKTGNGDIYILGLGGGALRRLTYADTHERPSSFSTHGTWLYFTTSRGNIGGLGAVYRMRVAGGTPMPVSLEPYRNEEAAVPSPDGNLIARVGLGWGSTQWWRDGHAHIDAGAIWILRNDRSHEYRRITPDDARALWPMWAADGRSVYYLSDRGGAENIWQVTLDGRRDRAVTRFTDGRCLWPTIAADGSAIAFQRGWKIWLLDTSTGEAHPVAVKLRGAVAGPGREHRTLRDGFSELALSPDGKKLAFIVHGEIFAIATGKKGPAQRITRTPAAEFDLTWAPDSRSIVYASERGSVNHLYRYDFVDKQERRLTHAGRNDSQPRFAPDGKHIAFIRGGEELEILNPASGRVRRLARGELALHHPLGGKHTFAWSPDGKWIAYLAWGERMYRNVFMVPFSGGSPRPVSFLGNTFSGSLHWSADGQSLSFATGQRTKSGHIVRVNLTPRTPEFRKAKFFNLFTQNTPSSPPGAGSVLEGSRVSAAGGKTAGGETRIDFDDIARRVRFLPTGLNVDSVAVSPNGKMLVFAATVGGHENLYTWPLDPLRLKPPVAHQITHSAAPKSSIQFAPGGNVVWYLSGGKVHSVGLTGAGAREYAISASMDVYFSRQKKVAFHEAWTWLADNFHDPDMNGVNWKAVRMKYAPLVAGARRPATLHALLRQMVGELDSSHSGVFAGDSVTVTGYLGLRFDPAIYEQRGELKISRVIPLGPAAVAGNISVGDYLVGIGGTPLTSDTNIYALLAHRIGKQTPLMIASGPGAREHRKVRVKPVSLAAAAHLTYEVWSAHNREKVAELSHGKLGYIHLPDMTMASLMKLYRSINALNGTREGVVIDVRNNYGGFVNAYALDVLARQPSLNMKFRGMQRAGARPLLGQRALQRPTVLIANRVTLSDGEDFVEGYEELGLGKVVGEPTAGWIVYTSDAYLIDGSVLRLPFITMTTHDGRPMEKHPRPVDVYVREPLGSRYQGKDPRLAAAVKVLLEQIGASRIRDNAG